MPLPFKKSIFLALISLLLKIPPFFFVLPGITNSWVEMIGLFSMFFTIIGIFFDYKDEELRFSRWISIIPWNGRWLYIHSSWLLFITLLIIPAIEPFNTAIEIALIVLWLLSGIIAVIAGILATPPEKLKIKGKRKKNTCPKCGAKLSPGYAVCSQCGEKIPIEE